jgi:hypothetical protein
MRFNSVHLSRIFNFVPERTSMKSFVLLLLLLLLLLIELNWIEIIIFGVKRRPDLEFFHVSVWVECTLSDGHNLLIGNHYFAPDIKVDIINNYFNFLEN